MTADEPRPCPYVFEGVESQLEEGHDGVCMTVAGRPFSHEDAD